MRGQASPPKYFFLEPALRSTVEFYTGEDAARVGEEMTGLRETNDTKAHHRQDESSTAWHEKWRPNKHHGQP